ncbi:unnamed protein product [Allacma fusca]|uniref:Uncharacterized protein n=1 Tax=Allacma fusca TaxID=39272 RepID=A0A8J2JXD7_9HEXA|nr:unnamed protein product [Allacma fusca]
MFIEIGNKSNPKISVPEKLLELSKPVFQCLRAIGFLSLTIQPDRTVTGGWKSKASLWTLLTILFSLASTSTVTVANMKFQRVAKFTPTEKFVHTFLYAMFTLTGLIFQLLALCNSRRSELFWKFHNYQFELYTSIGEQFDFCLKNYKHAKKYSNIQSYTRRWVLTGLISSLAFILFSGVFSFYSFFYNISDPWDISGYAKDQEPEKELDDQKDSSTVFKICFVFATVTWLLRNCLHVALVIYKTFFLKLYCACLEVVAQELDNVEISTMGHCGTITFENFQLLPLVPISKEKQDYHVKNNSDDVVRSCLQSVNIVLNLIDSFGCEMLLHIVYYITLALANSFFTLFSIIKSDHNNALFCIILSAVLALQIYQLFTESGKIKTTANQVLSSLCRLDVAKLPEDLQKNVGGILRIRIYL